MKFKKRMISVGDAVRLALGPEKFFANEYVSPEVLRENRVIHQMLGADNTEEVELELTNGWILKGVPDKILDDRVVEVKVQRPLSKPSELLTQAAYQGLLYARALGLENVEVWLYVYATGEVKSFTYALPELHPVRFIETLEFNLNILTTLQAFKPAKLEKHEATKLALKVEKYERD